MDKKEIGNKGEAFAAEYYRKLGFQIAARNFHCRGGEIDIIVENSEYIIFVEVKTRALGALVSPQEAVDEKKQRKLSFAATKYLEKTQTDKQPQFDVFEVYSNNGRIFRYHRIENAFEGFDFGGRYDIF